LKALSEFLEGFSKPLSPKKPITVEPRLTMFNSIKNGMIETRRGWTTSEAAQFCGLSLTIQLLNRAAETVCLTKTL